VSYIDNQVAEIAAGQALSGAVPLGEKTLVGVLVPANWSAASLTFQASIDDVNYFELVDGSGNPMSFTVAAGQIIAVDPATWRGVTSVKVRSGTSAAPVNQAVAVSLTLITRTVY
jgi:hypothetical protein